MCRTAIGPAESPQPSSTGVSAVSLLTIGGVCGLAWAASLRGFMAQVAGSASSASWVGTFVWILLPGVVAGLLLGWAEHLRRTGGRPGWRWLALAPLTFVVVLLPGLQDPTSMLDSGVGGGAIGVPVWGLAGGYALSRRGPATARIACGALFLTMIPIWVLTVPAFGGADLAVTTARGLWVALYYWSLLTVLALACAIPHRPVTPPHAERPMRNGSHIDVLASAGTQVSSVPSASEPTAAVWSRGTTPR